MNTFESNRYDPIEQLIFEAGIRIRAIDLHPEMDLMLIVLSTAATLRFRISSFIALKNAVRNGQSLGNYELVAGGLGIHWPELDEDLSLKGFLQQELKQIAGIDKGFVQAA